MFTSSNVQKRFTAVIPLFSLPVVLLILLILPLQAAQQYAEVNLAPSSVSAVPLSAEFTYMELRILAPTGEMAFQQHSDGSRITWYVPSTPQDGHYSWEVRLGRQQHQVRGQENGVQVTRTRSERESGGFLLLNGSIVDQARQESMLKTFSGYGRLALHELAEFLLPSAHADQVIIDDLVISGSECVGVDCVNGESFGFDTLRLKENNLRIKFQDTSNSGSFPSTDWEIVANDSTNGGESYLSIMDVDSARRIFTLKAGAPANALYVSSSGSVGLGTSTPTQQLHLSDGNTPAIRLEQDGSAGWTPQSWDISANETDFAIVDVTNGTTKPVRITPGAPSNTLFIADDGKIGLGTAAPTETLHVAGNTFIGGNLEIGSSRTVKNNIRPLQEDEASATFAKLQPVKFQYRVAPDEESVGFIAEELPDLVATNSRQSVSTMDVVAVMTKVVQKQQRQIEELTQMVSHLQQELEKATPAQGVTVPGQDIQLSSL